MRHKQLRAPIAVAVALATMVTLAGCGGGQGSSSSDPHSVTLLQTHAATVAAPLDKILTGTAMQATGITVTVQDPGGADEQVDQRLAADRVAGTLPDVAVVSSASVRTYVDAGLAQPLDALISSDSSFARSDYNPSLFDLGQVKGHTYAMPFTATSIVLYYNPTVLKAAGLDPAAPPTTFSQLAQAAQAIVNTKAAKYGVTFPYDSDGMWPVQNFLASAGGTWVNADETKPTFNTPQLAGIVNFFRGLGPQAAPVLAKTDAREAFYRGDLGMLIDSTGTLATSQSNSKFEVKFAPYPVPDGGTRKIVPAGETLVMFTKDPAKQRAVWQVIKQIIGPDGSTAFAETNSGGTIGLNKAANETEAAKYPIMGPLLGAQFTPWYQFPGSHGTEIWSGLRDQIVRALKGQTPTSEALSGAESSAESLFP